MNSRVALADAAKLISKLIDRTREGKITWTASTKRRSLDALETPLEANLKVTVWMANKEAGFRVSQESESHTYFNAPYDASDEDDSMIGSSETILLSIFLADKDRVGRDFPEEDYIYKDLVELHELARRSAYKMDAKFEGINDYLDRIAG